MSWEELITELKGMVGLHLGIFSPTLGAVGWVKEVSSECIVMIDHAYRLPIRDRIFELVRRNDFFIIVSDSALSCHSWADWQAVAKEEKEYASL